MSLLGTQRTVQLENIGQQKRGLHSCNKLICRWIEDCKLGVLSRLNMGQVVSFEPRKGQVMDE